MYEKDLKSECMYVCMQVLLVLSVFLYLPLVAMVFQLAGFHLMLIYRGETTYDFIVGEQKRQVRVAVLSVLYGGPNLT